MTSRAHCDVTKKLYHAQAGINRSQTPGACLGHPGVRNYKNPLHLHVVDRYLRRMGDKTIPDEALEVWNRLIPHESQVSINPNQGVVDSLSRSLINTNKVYFKVKTQEHRRFAGCLTVAIHIRKWRLIAYVVMVTSWRLFVMQSTACHPLRLKP